MRVLRRILHGTAHACCVFIRAFFHVAAADALHGSIALETGGQIDKFFVIQNARFQQFHCLHIKCGRRCIECAVEVIIHSLPDFQGLCVCFIGNLVHFGFQLIPVGFKGLNALCLAFMRQFSAAACLHNVFFCLPVFLHHLDVFRRSVFVDSFNLFHVVFQFHWFQSFL